MNDTTATSSPTMHYHLPDDVSVRHWLAFYGLFLLAAGVALAILIPGEGWAWSQWRYDFSRTLAETSVAVKLLVFAVYVSLCCTFLPLPTGGVAAAVATQGAAVTGEIWTTTLVVAVIGALASTLANLNDYHLFTWMLRHHRIAAVRHTRMYVAAARWFARSPFWILVIFNFIPIPVDVVRMLATTYRYPRVPFAAANFIGRFIRYAVIAFVTFTLGSGGWVAVIVLFAIAIVLGLARLLPPLAKKLFQKTLRTG